MGQEALNFYTSRTAFQKILKSYFYLDDKYLEQDENDKNIDLEEKVHRQIEEIYLSRQAEFHKEMELLNAWITCQRGLNSELSELNISKKEASDFVSISLDRINSKNNISLLSRTYFVSNGFTLR